MAVPSEHFDGSLALAETACGNEEFNPPFPFPQGESRGGRVPPTPVGTMRRQQKTLALIVAAGSPHKRTAVPLCIPCERDCAMVERSEQPHTSEKGSRPKSADAGDTFTQNT
jgi:hypothetical protein